MKRKLEIKRKNKPKICISDKICFKAKTVTKDKEDHYIIIKGSSQQEDTTFVNIYVPEMGGPKYKKWILTEIKVEIDSNTIIGRELIIPYTSMDRLQTEN